MVGSSHPRVTLRQSLPTFSWHCRCPIFKATPQIPLMISNTIEMSPTHRGYSEKLRRWGFRPEVYSFAIPGRFIRRSPIIHSRYATCMLIARLTPQHESSDGSDILPTLPPHHHCSWFPFDTAHSRVISVHYINPIYMSRWFDHSNNVSH